MIHKTFKALFVIKNVQGYSIKWFPIIIIENKCSGHQSFNGREIARLRLSKKLVFFSERIIDVRS